MTMSHYPVSVGFVTGAWGAFILAKLFGHTG